MNVTLWHHAPRSTLTFQRLSAPSCSLIGYTWYTLGIKLEYSIIYYVYTLCICLVYTMYILSIYYVYTQYIPCIYWVNVLYIIAIKYVYTWYIPCGTYQVYFCDITVIVPPDWYMHGIYKVYTMYISGVCSPNTFGQYIRSKTFLGLFCTFFIRIYVWYTFDIPCIFNWYLEDIKGISLYKRYWTNLEMSYYVYTDHMYEAYKYLEYIMYISCIY